MSSLSDTTSDIKISDAHLWRLAMSIGRRGIRFLAHNPQETNSMIVRSIAIENNGTADGAYLKSLENTVYDNTFLLNDFGAVDVMVEAPHFLFLPPEYGDVNEVEDAFKTAFPDDDGEVCVTTGNNCGADVAFSLPRGVMPFLQRTFGNAPVRLHLEVLSSYFKGKTNFSTVNKEYVYLRDGHIDVCVFKRGQLHYANTFKARSSKDMMFYILSVWNSFSLDVISDEIQIAGDKAAREEIVPVLRNYVTYVLPMILPPATLKLGNDAAKAPFDLILMSI